MRSRKLGDLSRWASAAVLLPAVLTSSTTLHAQSSSETTFSAAGASALVTPSVKAFHFADGADDLPGRLTADASGNFYVAAQVATDSLHPSSFAVLKYRFDGTLQGALRYRPAAGEFGGVARDVKVDKLGNIYAVGDTTLGGLVVSFTSSGSQRWARHFSTSAVALAIDGAGNVYAAGTRVTGDFQGEWLIAKYTSAGQLLWARAHTGTAHGDVRLTDIRLDPAGNPVVLGTTNILVTTVANTMTTLKLDTQGNKLWVRDFVAVQFTPQIPFGLAVDAAGSVYATGATNPPEGDSIPFTVKYDVIGNRKFVLTGSGAGGASVAIDPSGDILLAGVKVVQGLPPSTVASKFHANGVKVWATRLATGQKIVSDAAGNVFVAGSIVNDDTTNVGPSDYLIAKLSPSGTVVFQFRFSPGDDVSDSAVDVFGNLLVTGSGLNAQFDHDIFTLRVK